MRLQIRVICNLFVLLFIGNMLFTVIADPPPPYVVCYYPGPDVSEDDLQLTDFKVESMDFIVTTETVLQASFKITYVGMDEFFYFGKGGLVLRAQTPSGRKVDLATLPVESMGRGATATLTASDIVLREEGEWIIWPSYTIHIERGIAAAPIIKDGPEYWHACHVRVSTPATPTPPTTTPAPPTTTPAPPTTTPMPSPAMLTVIIEKVSACLEGKECVVEAQRVDSQGNVLESRSMIATYSEETQGNVFSCTYEVIQGTWILTPELLCSPNAATINVGPTGAVVIFTYTPADTTSPWIELGESPFTDILRRLGIPVPSGSVERLDRRITTMQKLDIALVAKDNEGGAGIYTIKAKEIMEKRSGEIEEKILDDIRIDAPRIYRRELSYTLGPYKDCVSVTLSIDICDHSGNHGHFDLIMEVMRVPCGCGWSNVFEARFTHYDDLASGDLFPWLEGDEIVIAIDEDADGDNGLFYIYDCNGELLHCFEAFYTKHDRIIVGDVTDLWPGDELIVVANDDGGRLFIYTAYQGGVKYGLKIGEFDVRFTKYDGIGVGDIDGDGVNEILIAVDEDKKIYIYSVSEDSSGSLQLVREDTIDIDKSVLGWKFEGCRYTYGEDHKGSAYDGFLVGDVIGDGKAEIVMLRNKNGDDSEIYIYEYVPGSGLRELKVLPARFTKKDGVYLGNVMGDEKLEIVIAIDEDDAVYIYSASLGLLKVQYMRFTKYDGLACGDVDGDGRDEILIVIDEDDKLYIGGVRDEV